MNALFLLILLAAEPDWPPPQAQTCFTAATTYVCCPGKMSVKCCQAWIKLGGGPEEKPACASGGALPRS